MHPHGQLAATPKALDPQQDLGFVQEAAIVRICVLVVVGASRRTFSYRMTNLVLCALIDCNGYRMTNGVAGRCAAAGGLGAC